MVGRVIGQAELRSLLDEPDTTNFRGRFEPRYRELWLRQNRRGGLNRSLALVFGNEYP